MAVLKIYCRCVVFCRTPFHGATWPVSICPRRRHHRGTTREATPVSCKTGRWIVRWATRSTLQLPSLVGIRPALHLVWVASPPSLLSTHRSPARAQSGGGGGKKEGNHRLCVTGPAPPFWKIYQILPRKRQPSHCRSPRHG